MLAEESASNISPLEVTFQLHARSGSVKLPAIECEYTLRPSLGAETQAGGPARCVGDGLH